MTRSDAAQTSEANPQTEADVAVTDAGDHAIRPVEVEETFDRTIAEGRRRLYRPWAPLVATGLVGGTDVATGVLAFLLVRQAGLVSLMRLWAITLVANLVAGWLITGLIMAGVPAARSGSGAGRGRLRGAGDRLAPVRPRPARRAVITLMTWSQHSVNSYGIKLIPAVTAGFLLAGGGPQPHRRRLAAELAGLHTGVSPYGYAAWAESPGWAALGNLIGGVALVTLLRLLQVPHRVRGDRAAPAADVTLRTATGRRKSHV